MKCVRAIDAAKIKEAFVEATGLDAALIERFVVYGELMCNTDLYDYTKNKVAKTFQLFGAMILPSNEEAKETILEKGREAGFSIVKEEQELEDEEVSIKLQVCFNKNFKDLADKFNYPTVPLTNSLKRATPNEVRARKRLNSYLVT